MANVDAINVRFGGDTSDLEKAVRRANSRMESFAKTARKVGRGIAEVGAATGAAAAGVAVMVNRSLQLADSIGKASIVAGTTTGQIQELRFALGQLAGTSDRDVDLALQRFNRRLGLARNGATEYAKAMRAVGVVLSRDTKTNLETAIRSLADVEDSADRSARASLIFGEEAGPKLAAALSEGLGPLEALRAAIRDDGGIISEENIKRAEEFNDQMDLMRKTVDADMAKTVLDNAEALESLAQGYANVRSAAVGAIASLANFGRSIGRTAASVLYGDPRGTGQSPGDQIANPDGNMGLLGTGSSASGGGGSTRSGSGGGGSLFGGLAAIVPPAATMREGAASMDELLEKAKEADRVFADTRTSTESYASEVQRLVDLMNDGFLSQDTFNRAVEQAGEMFSKDQFQEQFDELRNSVSGALVDGVRSGGDGMLDAFSNIIGDMAAQVLQGQLSSAFAGILPGGSGGSGGGGFLASAGAFVGSLFGGARANGGPVNAGRTYLVGERGPEMFSPSSSGNITSNAAMTSSGGQTVFSPTINVGGQVTARDLSLVRAEMSRQLVQFVDVTSRGRGLAR